LKGDPDAKKIRISLNNQARSKCFELLDQAQKSGDLRMIPGGQLFSPTCGHLFFPHPLCHLAGMKKRRDQYIQMFIRHPGLKSDS